MIKEEKQTFTAMLRKVFYEPLIKIGEMLVRWGISANMITLFALVGTLVGAYLVSQGKMLTGGIVIMAMGALDGVDGAVARAAGEIKPSGAFLDSVSDRYGELGIYAGLGWYFSSVNSQLGVILSIFALGGAVLVSYTRARAEGLGIETKVGILTRAERLIVIVLALVINIPLVGVGVVAVLANVTALQRVVHVWQQAEGSKKGKSA